MLIVAAAADELRISLGANPAAGLHCLLSYREITDATGAEYKPRPAGLLATGTGPATLLAGNAGFVRVVDFLSIYNPNAANSTVTIAQRLAGTDYILKKVVLGQDERLEYQEGQGWRVLTSAGSLKTSLNQGNNAVAAGQSTVVLASDVTNNNATANTIANITGLQFPVVAGQRYAFEFLIRYTAAATTTGARFSITGPTFDELTYHSQYSLTTTSLTFNSGLNAYDLPAASNASSAAVAGNQARIFGFIRPTANGDVVARFASEVASSAIIAKAGSLVRYQAL